MNERVKLLLIAAMCRERGIGKKNELPWHLPKEFAYFSRITKDVSDKSKKNAVILGRLTWESLPPKFRPLPSRVNIVISRQKDYPLPEGVFLAGSVEEAVCITQREGIRETIESVWVLGGEQIYRQAIASPQCHRVYLTHIDAHFADCDTFFPEFNVGAEPGHFKDITGLDAEHGGDERVPKGTQEENGINYEFKVYERI